MRKPWFVLAAIMLFPCAYLFSQEWSAAQKEVWKNVEAYWALYDEGNLEGYMGYIHNDYVGWSYSSALPMDKTTVRKFVDHDLKTSKAVLSVIKPAAIGVFGNVAFADYVYTVIYKDAEGKEKSESGRYTDILMKQGDKWLLIGDHGGRTSKE